MPQRIHVAEQIPDDVGAHHGDLPGLDDVPVVDVPAREQNRTLQVDVGRIDTTHPKSPTPVFSIGVFPHNFSPPQANSPGRGRHRVGLGRQARDVSIGQLDRPVGLVTAEGHLRATSFHPNAVDRVVGELAFHPILQAVTQPLHHHQNENAQGHADASQRGAKRVGQHVVGHFQPGVPVKHAPPIPPTRHEAGWCADIPRRFPPRGSPQPWSCRRRSVPSTAT